MLPTLTRRLGACVNLTTKFHHARLSTTAIRRQKLPSDHQSEHLDRLSLLQAEELEKLKPVKAKIHEYNAVLNKAQDFLTSLPAALAPLVKSENTAHTVLERRLALADAENALRKLKDATLPNLLAHVQDLELEAFPEPGSDESEIEFLQRARSMDDEERRDLLDSLNLEFGAAIAQATESVQSVKWSYEATSGSGSDAEPTPVIERKGNPFPKAAAKTAVAADAVKKVVAEEKAKFGMSPDDQFKSVIADAAPREDAFKKRKVVGKNYGLGENTREAKTWKPEMGEKPKASEPKDTPRRLEEDAPRPKPSPRDLNSLQAQLEASFKKSANR